MTQPQILHWPLPQSATPVENLLAERTGLELVCSRPQRRDLHWLDSYGRALWQGERLLFWENDQLVLMLADGCTLGTQKAALSLHHWRELPTGPVRSGLRPLLGEWSFYPQARLTLQEQALVLRNADAKIVLRGSLSSAQAQCLLRLQGLRGYEKAFRRVTKALSAELGDALPGPGLRELLLAQGVEPKPADEAPELALAPERPARAAVADWAGRMARQARRYEAGIIADTDTECLHQYRVSLRRLRSLLSLMRPAFPRERRRLLLPLVRELVSPTGQLRDLDVLLQQRDSLAGLLRGEHAQGLQELFDVVSRERDRAQRALSRRLQGVTHARRFASLDHRLQDDLDCPSSPDAAKLGDLCLMQLRKQHRHLVKACRHIDSSSHDEDIHALRIECKKLRYLIEFHQSFERSHAARRLLRELKTLQQELGDFNDCVVQQQRFSRYAAAARNSKAQAAACRALVSAMARRQSGAREAALHQIERFGRRRKSSPDDHPRKKMTASRP